MPITDAFSQGRDNKNTEMKQMKKNIKYESFGAGRAGQGRIDLQNGEVEFSHCDITSDSNILSISISHVYSTAAVAEPSTVYGKGFRLNLHQTLKKGEDPNDTGYVLTDAACKEHEFKDVYYYLNSEGKKEYNKMVNGNETLLAPGDITIGLDGKLTFVNGEEKHRIFTESRTDSGLILIKTGLEGFKDADKIETQHEELVQVKEDIKGLERGIADLEFAIGEYGKFERTCTTNNDEECDTECCNEGNVYWKLKALTKEINEKSIKLENAAVQYTHEELKGLKTYLLDRQTELQEMREGYDNDEENRMKNRYKDLKDRAYDDWNAAKKMLERKNFVLKRYEEQIPVNYISDQAGLTYGFNEHGDLVIIWDIYGNYVSLAYEDGVLIKTIDTDEKEILFEYTDGKLSSIIDPLDRRTVFSYDGDHLKMIVYPSRTSEYDGDVSRFTYQNDMLSEIMPPTGIGLRLEYDIMGRPVKIVDVTSVECIDADGLTDGAVQTEDIILISYNEHGTATEVTNPRTGYRTTYLFNSEEELVTEYTDLDTVMKSIRTYDVGDKKCYFTMQQTDFDNDLITQPAMIPIGSATVLEPNGDVIMPAGGLLHDRFAVWDVDPYTLPAHTTDMILSGFAIADSEETPDRRRTEYCGHSGHEHSENNNTSGPWFDLVAEIGYPNGKTKTFIASFDWRIKTKQFVAIPITLDEDANGEPKMPDYITIIAKYMFNKGGECRFFKPSLACGDWSYAAVDHDNRKTFECSNHRLSDKTVDGVKDGTFIKYVEKFYEYDENGNLVQEKAVLERNGKTREYVTRYEYNKQSRLIRTISPNGMVSEAVYDKKGSVIKTLAYHISNPASRFVSESELSESGRVIAEWDGRGENRTVFEYANGTNMLSGIVSPVGQKAVLGPDPHTDDVLAISSSVDGEPNTTRFNYTKGLLTRLSSGGTDYDYRYDKWGRNKEIKIAGAPYVEISYDTDGVSGNEIVTAVYSNNEQYETVTDKFGKLLKVDRIVNSVRKTYLSYIYDAKDRPIKTIDHHADKVIEYIYNEDGSVNRIKDGDVETITDRNINGAAEKVNYLLAEMNDEQAYTNVYDDEGKLSEIILPNNETEKIKYDSFGRVTEIEHPVHDEKICYYQNGANATNIVASVQQTGKQNNGTQNTDRTKYKYDANGNITEIRENNKLVVRYGYDGLNRLIREDNVRLGKSFTLDYDANGNILSKNAYKLSFNRYLREYPADLSSGLGLPPGEESRYCYEEEGNRDRLKEFNGEVCEYDALGNPFVYRNKDLKWDRLKDLVKYDGTRFAYDATGLRISKARDGNKTKFYWSGNKLLAERRTFSTEDLELGDPLPECGNECVPGCTLHSAHSNVSVTDITYIQGADGLTGFVVSRDGIPDATYYYRKNTQGDITHILDQNGTVKAEYVYDAWGEHKIITDEEGIGSINPFRYRGYYYDDETGLYYLRSRYYDPQTGRFINADSIGNMHPEEVNGMNLYSYCGSNPVMFSDPSGECWLCRKVIKPIQDTVNTAVSVVAGAATGMAGAFVDALSGMVDWVDNNIETIVAVVVVVALVAVTIATAGAASPILLGAMIGASIGGATSVATQLIFTGTVDLKQFFVDVAVGAALGAIGGSALGKTAMTLAGAGIGFGSSIASDVVAGRSIDLGAAVLGGGIGAVPGIRGKVGAQQKFIGGFKTTQYHQHLIKNNPALSKSGFSGAINFRGIMNINATQVLREAARAVIIKKIPGDTLYYFLSSGLGNFYKHRVWF